VKWPSDFVNKRHPIICTGSYILEFLTGLTLHLIVPHNYGRFLDVQMSTETQVRILVVDDYERWRQSISFLLEACPEFQVVGEASDGLEAVQRAEELKPDLILLDIGLPNLNGIEAESRLRQTVPSAKILFLTQENDADLARKVLSDGAQGYVLKTDAGRELLSAIKTVVRGEKFASSGIKWHDFSDWNVTAASFPAEESPS
jgi:DNA-binding NarL/FixJ family response regulator